MEMLGVNRWAIEVASALHRQPAMLLGGLLCRPRPSTQPAEADRHTAHWQSAAECKERHDRGRALADFDPLGARMSLQGQRKRDRRLPPQTPGPPVGIRFQFGAMIHHTAN
jgi:hypothetical protein